MLRQPVIKLNRLKLNLEDNSKDVFYIDIPKKSYNFNNTEKDITSLYDKSRSLFKNTKASSEAPRTSTDTSKQLSKSLPLTYQILRNDWRELVDDFKRNELSKHGKTDKTSPIFYDWFLKTEYCKNNILTDIVKLEARIQQLLHKDKDIIKKHRHLINHNNSSIHKDFIISRYDYPIDDIYQSFYVHKKFINGRSSKSRDSLISELLQISQKPTNLLITRNKDENGDTVVDFVSINPSMKRFIRLLQRNTLSVSIDRILIQYPDFDIDKNIGFLLRKNIIKI